MTTKLNSYILPNFVIEKMKERIEETKTKKVEEGFGLCRLSKTNIIRSGDECIGTACSITTRDECMKGGLYVGGFHTHPKTGADPSIADLLHAFRHDVECIGSARDNDIKCFLRVTPKHIRDEENISKISKEIEEPLTGRTPSQEEYRKWKDARNDILNQYFKEIEIK